MKYQKENINTKFPHLSIIWGLVQLQKCVLAGFFKINAGYVSLAVVFSVI